MVFQHRLSSYERREEVKMREEKVGEVIKFFAKPSVAAVKITDGELNVGDAVKFTGFTTDYETKIESIEINNQKVEKATAGEFVGIKVGDRVRPGDELFKILP
jgi:putative protease